MSSTQLLQQTTNNHGFKRQADVPIGSLAESVEAAKVPRLTSKRQKTGTASQGDERPAP